MTIWTSFFLVLSAVILAYPFLASGDDSRGGDMRPDKNRPDLHSSHTNRSDINSPWHEEEVQLDLASGRLDPDDQGQDDHETGAHETGERPAGDDPAEAPVSSEEDNGSLSEG